MPDFLKLDDTDFLLLADGTDQLILEELLEANVVLIATLEGPSKQQHIVEGPSKQQYELRANL